MSAISERDIAVFREAIGTVEPCPSFVERHKKGSVWYVDCVREKGHAGVHELADREWFRGR